MKTNFERCLVGTFLKIFLKKVAKNFGSSEKVRTFATSKGKHLPDDR